MKRFLAILLCTPLWGCAQFDNRVACTVGGDQALFVSMYMRVGVASVVSDKDSTAICKKGA